MKSLGFAFMSLIVLGFSVGASIAKAEPVALNYIDTNDCSRALNEVRLLNLSSTSVTASCAYSADQGFGSDQGGWYYYRLTTVVNIPGYVYPGMQVRLNDIDTNDCNWASQEISLLNSSRVRVTSVCSPYIYQGYGSDQGYRYNYRLYTTLTIN